MKHEPVSRRKTKPKASDLAKVGAKGAPKSGMAQGGNTVPRFLRDPLDATSQGGATASATPLFLRGSLEVDAGPSVETPFIESGHSATPLFLRDLPESTPSGDVTTEPDAAAPDTSSEPEAATAPAVESEAVASEPTPTEPEAVASEPATTTEPEAVASQQAATEPEAVASEPTTPAPEALASEPETATEPEALASEPEPATTEAPGAPEAEPSAASAQTAAEPPASETAAASQTPGQPSANAEPVAPPPVQDLTPTKAETAPPPTATDATAAAKEPTPAGATDLLTPEPAAESQKKGDEEAAETADALAEGLDAGATPPAGDAAEAGGGGGGGGGGAAVDGGGDDGGLASWKAGANAAIAGVPAPEAPDAEAVKEPLEKHAKEAKDRTMAGTGSLQSNLVDARPKPPEPNPPFPPVIQKKEQKDFVPEATAIVTAATSKQLPEQKVPALSESPQKHMPVIEVDESGRMTFTAKTQAELEAAKADAAAKEAAKAEEQKKKDGTQQAKVEKGQEEAKAEPKPPKPGEELVLGAEAPKPAPPRKMVPGEAYARQVTLGNVAAMLLADVGSQSKSIVDSGRKAAFPPRQPMALLDPFKELGQQEMETATTQLLDKRLRKIAAEVGVTGDKLDKMIALRKQELSDNKEKTTENLLAAVNESDKKIEAAGDEKKKAIKDAKKAVDEDTEEKLVAARGEHDPEVVAMRRDRMLDKVNSDVGHATVAYEKLGKARADTLSREEAIRGRAYDAAAKKDEEVLLAAAGADEQKKKAALVDVMASRKWAKDKTAEIAQLRTDAAAAVKTIQEGLKLAGTQAREKIRDWAANMEGEERSWWERLWEMFKDWGKQSQAVSDAWEEDRTQETSDAIMQDRGQLEQLKAMVEKGVIDPKNKESLDKLTDEQKAIVTSYFADGPDKGNAIAAVASGMRARLAGERVPEIAKSLEELALGIDDWRPLGKLAAAIRPGFNVQVTVSELWKAMDQWGTDEDAVYRALSGLSPLENKIVHKAYKALHGIDLDDHIRDEFSGTEKDRALSLAQGNQAKADAAALRDAMKGGLTGAGTDEKLIMDTLRNKTPEERAAIRAAYEAEYGVKLDDDLKDELSGHDIDMANAHLEGNTAKADAIALDQSMRGGFFFGLGTDRGEIENVYKRNRDEVMAEASRHPEWTTAEVEAEITRRNNAISKEFGAKYAADYGTTADKALETAFQADLSGPELDLVTALQKNDLVAADAARIRIETTSVFYASDSAMNAVLQDQFKRGHDEAKRDLTADFLKRKDAAKPPWSAEDLKKEQEALKANIETAARANGDRNMKSLSKTFDTNYKNPFEGGFSQQLEMNMSGYDREKARELVAQGGYLSPAQEAHYAMAGAGTDEEGLKKVFDGKTKAEVEAIKKEYREKYGRELTEDIKDETSGRDAFDLADLVQGKPDSPEDAIRRLKEKRRYEQQEMGLGNHFAEAEMARLDEEIAALEADARDLQRTDMSAEEKALKTELFYDYSVKAADRAVEDHRSKVDSVTDTAAQIAGIVALVVAVVVLTVITGGAAGVGFMAALGTVMSSGTLMATATAVSVVATIATKAAMRGPDYYASGDIVADVAIGVVDVATAGLTANMGGKLLGEGLKAGTKLTGLARMAQSSSRVTRVVAHMVAQGAEGLVSSLPSAIASNLANDKNWEGDAFGNIMGGIAMQAGIGTFVAGGMGALGGIARPEAKSLAKMAAEERHLLLESYQQLHPGSTLADLEADLAAGRIATVSKEALAEFRKELKDNLLDGLAPELRDQFNKIEIKVLSDAEFEAFTKSSSGQAAVIIEEGKPRVIIREGANPNVLREEGTHLAQMVDPKTSGLVAQLDEVHLANWEKLGVAEQLELYKVKIDLEIDAQRVLIANLEDQLARAENIAAREAVERELKAVRENLGNLLERADEVASISPAQKLRMSQGLEPKPQYLEQKPRLFNKKSGGIKNVGEEVELTVTEVGDSPLNKQGKGKVYQVGDFFEEEGRKYRLVAQLDEEGKVIKMREEIQLLDKEGKPDPNGRWVQRGSEGRERGIVAEAASIKQSDKAAQEAALKGETHIQVPTQNASGQGFDEARIIFNPDGTASIKVVEVKDYPGRYVPGADFTAIDKNLKANLERLEKDLEAALKKVQLGEAETALGMTEQQLESALDAIQKRRIDFEIRVTPETNLATEEAGSVLKKLRTSIGETLGIDPKNLKLDASKIDDAFMQDALAETEKSALVGKKVKLVPRTSPSPDVTPQMMEAAEDALTKGKTAVVDEAKAVQKETAEALETLDENQAIREAVDDELALLGRVEEVTGVKKGADYDQAMADLKAFYEQQAKEAEVVLDVQGTRWDGPYRIDSRFDAREFSHGVTNVTVKVHLNDALLDPATAAEQLAKLKADAIAGIDKHFNLPTNTLQNGNRLHVEIEFVANAADAHLKVDVHPGQGRANQLNWFVDSDPTVHAHELGHQLGLIDEYVDPAVVNRAMVVSPGVRVDNSLMGDFWQRNATGNFVYDASGKNVVHPDTALKVRHVRQIGGDIEAAKAVALPAPPAAVTPTPGLPASAPLGTSVHAVDLPKFSALDAATVTKLETLEADSLRALGTLPQADLEKVAKLDAEGLQALSALPQADMEKVAKLDDVGLTRLREVGKVDADAFTRLSAANDATLARLTRLDDVELLNVGQLSPTALDALGRFNPVQTRTFANLDEATVRALGRLAHSDPTNFAKLANVEPAGLRALAGLGDAPLANLARLDATTFERLARLDAEALARFAALEPTGLVKFAGLSQEALAKFGKLDLATLQKFGELRYSSALVKYGNLDFERLEVLAMLPRNVLQKFGGWAPDVLRNIGGLPMKNILIIAKLDVAPGSAVMNVLADFKPRRLVFGSFEFILTRERMEHILIRHHPKFWEGSVKVSQSFLDPKLSVDELADAIIEVMKQNRTKVLNLGTEAGLNQMSGKYKGVDYVLGLNDKKVGQFYPG